MNKRALLFATSVAFLLVGLLGPGAVPVRGAGFVVSSSDDDSLSHDASPGDGVCLDQGGTCTLRAAIEEANAHPGVDTITFSTSMEILVDGSEGMLPSLNEQVTIDASGVWNSVADAPGVTINGQGGSFSGLVLAAGNCEVYGLHIINFGTNGIFVTSAANQIGGAGAGQRNVLSGNRNGVTLYSSSAKINILYNNYIGLTADGSSGDPNTTGLYIGNGASGNTVGGSGAGQANFISANTSDGVDIDGSGTDNNWLGGNAIGLASDLATNLGNGGNGILIRDGAANTVVGGSGTGNLIIHNAYSGVYVLSAGSGTEISHNIIGSNSIDGIYIDKSSNCIVSDNLIASNTLNGVRVLGASATGNLIWPNSITSNGEKGIHLQDGSNMSIAAPVISSANGNGASGTVCGGCRVALYSDAGDEGQIYHDIVWADGGGNWAYSGMLDGPNVTATAIDISGNTSEFSTPYNISNRIFLPFVQK